VMSVPNPVATVPCNCLRDAYTVQLNSDLYPLAPCGTNARCTGWEQLVYHTPKAQTKIALLYIQVWRIKIGETGLQCPPSSSGWVSAFGDCVHNSPFLAAPQIPIGQLTKVSLTLSAAPTGDSAFLTYGTKVYGMKDLQADFMDLSEHWTGAEFNVFGWCCSTQAVFNHGSKLTARLEVDDGSTAAPACNVNAGTTGETNSLSFVAAPTKPQALTYPSILFTESNTAGGEAASCDALKGM
jgi:hypothetical protein